MSGQRLKTSASALRQPPCSCRFDCPEKASTYFSGSCFSWIFVSSPNRYSYISLNYRSFSPILWCEHEMILAHPRRIYEFVIRVCHSNHLSFCPIVAGHLNYTWSGDFCITFCLSRIAVVFCYASPNCPEAEKNKGTDAPEIPLSMPHPFPLHTHPMQAHLTLFIIIKDSLQIKRPQVRILPGTPQTAARFAPSAVFLFALYCWKIPASRPAWDGARVGNFVIC